MHASRSFSVHVLVRISQGFQELQPKERLSPGRSAAPFPDPVSSRRYSVLLNACGAFRGPDRALPTLPSCWTSYLQPFALANSAGSRLGRRLSHGTMRCRSRALFPVHSTGPFLALGSGWKGVTLTMTLQKFHHFATAVTTPRMRVRDA